MSTTLVFLSIAVVVGFLYLRSRCCRPDYARDPLKLSIIAGGPCAPPPADGEGYRRSPHGTCRFLYNLWICCGRGERDFVACSRPSGKQIQHQSQTSFPPRTRSQRHRLQPDHGNAARPAEGTDEALRPTSRVRWSVCRRPVTRLPNRRSRCQLRYASPILNRFNSSRALSDHCSSHWRRAGS
jgi:hypothetical protein